MSIEKINPYDYAGGQFTAGLDYVAAELPVDPTIDDLRDKVVEYIEDTFFTEGEESDMPGFVENRIQSIIPSVINSYRKSAIQNGQVHFDGAQTMFIREMLGSIFSVPVKSVEQRLSDIEDKLDCSNLNSEQSAPLFMAISVGKAANEYWLNEIGTPTNWTTYLDSSEAINYMNFAYWVETAMEGTLLGYSQLDSKVHNPDVISNLSATFGLISAIGGAIGLNASKLVFDVIPKVRCH
ncbi:MAG: hypothetical protein WD048_10675 [Chitinophagales bacterium]